MDDLDAAALLATVSDTARLYALEGAAPITPLHVERWHAEDALSALYTLTVDALATRDDLDLDAMLGQQVALVTTQADGTQARRTGLVRKSQLLGADGGLARYRLTLVPWLWLLGESRHSRIFEDQTVLDIVGTVFGGYPGYASWKATSDATQWLAQVRPRSYTVQYRESDLAFVSRLLAEEGLGYTFIEDADAPSGHTLVIFAASRELPEDANSAAASDGLRFHRAASVEESDTIQALGQQVSIGPAAVNFLSWDYKSVSATSASLPVKGSGTGELYDPTGAYSFADSREAAHYAQIAAEALEGQQHSWVGRGTLRGARAGTRFRVAQSPWEAAGAAFPEAFVWTRITSAGINNLPKTLLTAVQARLGAASVQGYPELSDSLWKQAKATGYAQHFEAIDAALPFRPALEDEHGVRLNPRPTVPGPQTAIVVGPEGETTPGASGPLYTDKLGRLKVRFHFMEGGASCWLRCVQRYAGQGHGAQFLPRIGQEVLVGFMGGDIDRPVIVGALYNGQGEAGIRPTPGAVAGALDATAYAQAADFHPTAQGNLAGGNSPAWHGQSAAESGHANAAALSGIKTQGFDGAGYNQLVMDDTDQQGRIQFATTQSATQLNLGHLIHQADNYRGSFRGTGWELRTDGYGAVRGERGLLLSTYTRSWVEPAADVTAAIALLKQHDQLAQTLSQAATTHQTVPLAGHAGVAKANQSALNDKAAPLAALEQSLASTTEASDYAHAAPRPGAGAQDNVPHTQDALTALAGRAGIGAIAGQTLHVAAGETLNLGSGGHGNLAVQAQLRIHANQAIGMLAGAQTAHGTGLNLIAGKQPLTVEAQHDTLALRSRDDLKVISTNAAVEFAAKQAIHLANSQGAFIHLEGGAITFSCPGKLAVHAGNHKLEGATHLSHEMNGWGETKFDEELVLQWPYDNQPVANRKFEITRADGGKVHGITDANGRTGLQKSLLMEGIQMTLLPEA